MTSLCALRMTDIVDPTRLWAAYEGAMAADLEAHDRLLRAAVTQAGGEAAAKGHFRRMMENPETAFLGLRGMITQTLKAGDLGEALVLARRARDLRPRTAWVQATLLDLETRLGDWPAAQETLRQAVRTGALPPAQAGRHAAAIALERARLARAENRREGATAEAERAWNADPDHAAAAALLAELHLEAGKPRAAAAPGEAGWICAACGTGHARWQAICGHCGAFDRIGWTARADVAALPSAPPLDQGKTA